MSTSRPILITVFGAIALIGTLATIETAGAADVKLEQLNADAGAKCGSVLGTRRQFAVQCNSEAFVILSVDAGWGSPTQDPRVSTFQMYDVVTNGPNQRICVVAADAGAVLCNTFRVDPMTLLPGAP